MKTTIDIPKELLQSAKIHAVRNGTSLKEMVIRGLNAQVKSRATGQGKNKRHNKDLDAYFAEIEAIADDIEASSITNKSLMELLQEGRR